MSSGETHGPPPGSGTGAHRPDRDTRPWRYGDRSRGAASPEVQGEPGRERLPVLKDMAVLLKGVRRSVGIGRVGRAPLRSLMGADSAETFHGFLVDKRRKHDMIVQELNHSGVDQDEYPPDSCEESRRMVQGGEERRRISPGSLLLKDDASKCGRVMPVKASARDSGHEGPRPARELARRVVPQSVSALSLGGDRAFFFFRGERRRKWGR